MYARARVADGFYGNNMPSFVRNIVIISICALFVISELTYNSQLLRAWRRGQQGGKPGTGSDAAEHLWRSSRLFFLSIGYTLLACFVFSVVVMVGLRDQAYPSERETVQILATAHSAGGLSFLLAGVVTTAKLRLRVHLGRTITRVDPIISRPAASTTRSEIELTEINGGSDPAAAGPLGVDPLSNLVAGWEDVDLSSWRDAGGRFEGLQLISLLGVGGYSQVWLASCGVRDAAGRKLETQLAVK